MSVGRCEWKLVRSTVGPWSFHSGVKAGLAPDQ